MNKTSGIELPFCLPFSSFLLSLCFKTLPPSVSGGEEKAAATEGQSGQSQEERGQASAEKCHDEPEEAGSEAEEGEGESSSEDVER